MGADAVTWEFVIVTVLPAGTAKFAGNGPFRPDIDDGAGDVAASAGTPDDARATVIRTTIAMRFMPPQ